MDKVISLNPLVLLINKIAAYSPLFTGISDYFTQLFLKAAPSNVRNALMMAGILAITSTTLMRLYKNYLFWKWAPSFFFNLHSVNGKGLKERYGDCFVVITGCTDGIGLYFAKKMVEMGFGVVLVARNEKKLNKRIREIEEIYTDFKYYKVIGDLGIRQQSKRVSQQLSELATKIDIGIVINNAGVSGTITPYLQSNPREIISVLETNFYSAYLITQALIPHLRNRKHRSALINFASCTGVFQSPYLTSYPASKNILDIYTRSLALEQAEKIDVLSSRPFGVMTPMMKMNRGKFMITPNECVVTTLAALSKEDTTYSGFMHQISGSAYEMMAEKNRFKIYSEGWKKMMDQQ